MFYHVNEPQAFRLLQFSFFLVKMLCHYEVHVIFQYIEHQFQEKMFYQFDCSFD